MRRIIFLIFSFLLFATYLKSQEKIILYYNSLWEITEKDKAIYYRESEYDLNNFKLNGKVSDYTLSGNLLMEGTYSFGKKYGNFIFYFDNGVIKSEGRYENNKRIGYWKYYYNTGQLKQVILFKDSYNNTDFAVVEYYDNKGNQLITNGTGKWISDSIQTGMFDTESLKTITGNFKDSLKHGEWKLIRNSDNKMMHSERFRNGKFIEARIYNAQFNYYGTISSEILNKIPDENINKLNKTEKFTLDTTVFAETLINSDVETIFKTVTGKEYKILNRNSGYKYGDLSLFEFIASNIHYPINAIENRISGKVYVNIVIDSLGKTKDVKILKGLQKDIDEEALRVVKLINNWLPAIRDGKEIESTITVPVNFNLKE